MLFRCHFLWHNEQAGGGRPEGAVWDILFGTDDSSKTGVPVDIFGGPWVTLLCEDGVISCFFLECVPLKAYRQVYHFLLYILYIFAPYIGTTDPKRQKLAI